MENRIGLESKDKPIQWPMHNILGAGYERRGAIRKRIDAGGHFVVIPVNFTDPDGLIKLAQESLNKPPRAKKTGTGDGDS
jgi:hypothetical protein